MFGLGWAWARPMWAASVFAPGGKESHWSPGPDGKFILRDAECRVGFHRIALRWIKIFTWVEGKIEFTCSKPNLGFLFFYLVFFFFLQISTFNSYLISFLDVCQACQCWQYFARALFFFEMFCFVLSCFGSGLSSLLAWVQAELRRCSLQSRYCSARGHRFQLGRKWGRVGLRAPLFRVSQGVRGSGASGKRSGEGKLVYPCPRCRWWLQNTLDREGRFISNKLKNLGAFGSVRQHKEMREAAKQRRMSLHLAVGFQRRIKQACICYTHQRPSLCLSQSLAILAVTRHHFNFPALLPTCAVVLIRAYPG